MLLVPPDIANYWPALIGFALGSSQVLFIDWLRARAQHRRQLRLLRAELRRLAGFSIQWGWNHDELPPSDATPNPPRITPGYQRLQQDIDFWLTDEHGDDNTQEALINIADGAAILERYSSDAFALLDKTASAGTPPEKDKYRTRAIDTAQVYDKELDRWLIMVNSALADVNRRLQMAGTIRQVFRTVLPMPKSSNPPSLPTISHPPSER